MKKGLRAILLDMKDNVATVLENIEKDASVDIVSKAGVVIRTVTAKEAVPFRYKIAVQTIEANGDVLKYGEVIGRATTVITSGECVHIHNVREVAD